MHMALLKSGRASSDRKWQHENLRIVLLLGLFYGCSCAVLVWFFRGKRCGRLSVHRTIVAPDHHAMSPV
jgi:hypothetical protein